MVDLGCSEFMLFDLCWCLWIYNKRFIDSDIAKCTHTYNLDKFTSDKGILINCSRFFSLYFSLYHLGLVNFHVYNWALFNHFLCAKKTFIFYKKKSSSYGIWCHLGERDCSFCNFSDFFLTNSRLNFFLLSFRFWISKTFRTYL